MEIIRKIGGTLLALSFFLFLLFLITLLLALVSDGKIEWIVTTMKLLFFSSMIPFVLGMFLGTLALIVDLWTDN